jgi:hypothetical protein
VPENCTTPRWFSPVTTVNSFAEGQVAAGDRRPGRAEGAVGTRVPALEAAAGGPHRGQVAAGHAADGGEVAADVQD